MNSGEQESDGPTNRGKRSPRTFALENLLRLYKQAHPSDDESLIEPHRVADWAIAEGQWNSEPISPEQRLRREIANFLRHESFVDSEGRNVRANVAVVVDEATPTGRQRRSRWYPLHQAPPEHMRVSVQLRRNQALDDVKQLRMDIDSYNDHNIHEAVVDPPDFNFNTDIEESMLPTTYPDDVDKV